ncbi:MAG TPA: malto-oligosyltrehalose trehalohydrolase [Candidatus Dormibacteraeota bacterium]|jgi:maltooligosyltrehalose trehalohydrolase|nr:malto-oligosyltrehalose trehalohydrolase [Candidatus Dormibacteraeota bacterium]
MNRRFEVWAPRAGTVELAIHGQNLPMRRRDDEGWYVSDPVETQHGDRYGFVLDGAAPLPDPRSPWQPDGVQGLSAVVDHEAFQWTDQAWHGAPLASAVIYELHVGTFTSEGTFDAAIARLPDLVDLGVTAVELMPVAEFPGERGWGYDGVDLFAPHHAYGGPDGLKRLVDACHASGLAVVMDVVYNHLGPDGNHLGRFGPYFTDRYRTPWGDALNLDGPDSEPVRRFILDNAQSWLRDHHCDGLRLDAVHAIVDTSALPILEELAVEVEALQASLGRTLWLIAESDLNDPALVRSRESGGAGLDAQWSDDFHHALHAALTGERSGYYADFGPLSLVARALRDVFVVDGGYSRHRRRRHGRPVGGLPRSRFLGYLQDHDQVGNRALGERSSALMSEGKLRIGAALVLASPFVPMLFQGEEWAASTPFQYFTDHQDAELARAVSEGRRREFAAFGWRAEDVPDPQDPATFERSKLRREEREGAPHRDMLDWHRRLIALRRSHPSLADSRPESTEARADDDAGWLLLRRGAVSIACNTGDRPVRVDTGEAGAAARTMVLASHEGIDIGGEAITLPPESVVIWSTGGPPWH